MENFGIHEEQTQPSEKMEEQKEYKIDFSTATLDNNSPNRLFVDEAVNIHSIESLQKQFL